MLRQVGTTFHDQCAFIFGRLNTDKIIIAVYETLYAMHIYQHDGKGGVFLLSLMLNISTKARINESENYALYFV
jgi:hypothetical protein